MNGLLIGLSAAVLVLSAAVLKLLRERNEQRKMLNLTLERLDRAISGIKQETPYDESMDAAITERLNRLTDISRRSVEDADRERQTVQELISDIAHQVRTPLTNIMLYSGILQENLNIPENRKMADQIYSQSEKLVFFMKELVKSSYLESELIAVHPQTEEIDRLIAEACQELEVTALRKKILFQIEECGRKGRFDKKWTKEALVNLLDNAVKYSPEGSCISVGCVFYESFFCIQVKDQGMGIAESEQGAIFKRFYRSEAARAQRGLGIGLYLAGKIVEKQNGYMKVQSAPQKGSTFSIFLPTGL